MDSLTSMASSGLEGPLPRFPPHSVLLCLFLSLWGISSSGGSPCHGVVSGSSHFLQEGLKRQVVEALGP